MSASSSTRGPAAQSPCINRLIGSTAVWRASAVRCVYTCVVRALVWPRYTWMRRVHPVFQQMGGVGVSEGMHVGPLVHSALPEGPEERRLHARPRHGPGAHGDEVTRSLAHRGGKQPLRGP